MSLLFVLLQQCSHNKNVPLSIITELDLHSWYMGWWVYSSRLASLSIAGHNPLSLGLNQSINHQQRLHRCLAVGLGTSSSVHHLGITTARWTPAQGGAWVAFAPGRCEGQLERDTRVDTVIQPQRDEKEWHHGAQNYLLDCWRWPPKPNTRPERTRGPPSIQPSCVTDLNPIRRSYAIFYTEITVLVCHLQNDWRFMVNLSLILTCLGFYTKGLSSGIHLVVAKEGFSWLICKHCIN